MVRWLKTSTCNAEMWDQTSAQTTTGRWQQCVGSKPKTKLTLKLLPSNFNRCVHWFACGICFVDWLCQSGSRREQWAGKSGEPAGSTGFIINFILICRLIDWTWLQSSVQLTHNMLTLNVVLCISLICEIKYWLWQELSGMDTRMELWLLPLKRLWLQTPSWSDL